MSDMVDLFIKKAKGAKLSPADIKKLLGVTYADKIQALKLLNTNVFKDPVLVEGDVVKII